MSVTEIVVAPSITWLLVSTSPLEVSTMPVPAASSFSSFKVVLMSTRPGSTAAATDEAFGLPDAEFELPPVCLMSMFPPSSMSCRCGLPRTDCPCAEGEAGKKRGRTGAARRRSPGRRLPRAAPPGPEPPPPPSSGCGRGGVAATDGFHPPGGAQPARGHPAASGLGCQVGPVGVQPPTRGVPAAFRASRGVVGSPPGQAPGVGVLAGQPPGMVNSGGAVPGRRGCAGRVAPVSVTTMGHRANGRRRLRWPETASESVAGGWGRGRTGRSWPLPLGGEPQCRYLPSEAVARKKTAQ